MKIIVHGNMTIKKYVAPKIVVSKSTTIFNGDIINEGGTVTGNVYSNKDSHGTER